MQSSLPTDGRLEICLATGGVDRQMEMRPADALAHTVMEASSPSPAAPDQPTHALDVDLQDLTWAARLKHSERAGLGREELAQSMRPVTPQHAVRSPAAHPDRRADAVGSPAPLHTERDDRSLPRIRGTARGSQRATASVFELAATAAPAIDGVAADTEVAGGLAHPKTLGFAQQIDPGQRRRASGTVHNGPPTFGVVVNTRTLVGGLFV